MTDGERERERDRERDGRETVERDGERKLHYFVPQIIDQRSITYLNQWPPFIVSCFELTKMNL